MLHGLFRTVRHHSRGFAGALVLSRIAIAIGQFELADDVGCSVEEMENLRFMLAPRPRGAGSDGRGDCKGLTSQLALRIVLVLAFLVAVIYYNLD